MAHDERCKECKERIFELLSVLFGEVKCNYNMNLPNKPDSFNGTRCYEDLKRIFEALTNYRGFRDFVRAKRMPNVDFFVVNPGFIVEFDESQHFTKPREIVLLNYPDYLFLGFQKQKWINLSVNLNKKDNNPLFRDEQRAWYDTIRDFASNILGIKPTVRLFSRDTAWCNLDPKKDNDLHFFRNIMENKNAELSKDNLAKS